MRRQPARSRDRRLLAVVSATCLVTIATACGGQPDTRHPGATDGRYLSADVALAPRAARVDLAPTRDGLRRLGHSLTGRLAADSDSGNVVLSPASLAFAFAMLREGAAPTSGREIDAVVGLPGNRRAAYNAVLHDLAGVGSGDVLEVGNGLFVSRGYRVRPAYLETIGRWYGAGVHETEFPEQAARDVNAWVRDQTHGRIERLVDSFGSEDVLALVNTVYLDARWAAPFPVDATTDRPFTTAAGERVQVPTMSRTGALDYAAGRGWQAVRLPYRDGVLSMWVVVPTAHRDPVSLLRPAVLAAAADRAETRQVGLRLPRWKFDTTADLTGTLRRLGLVAPFTAGQLPGIAADPRLAVDKVIQQTTIAVAEEGTEAAAASAVGMAGSAPPSIEVTVAADSPFAFAIVHDRTGVPLFAGVVADPSSG